MYKYNKGFSLIELVIVIAIIAILVSVLVPTFSNIIEKSNNAKTIENARIKYENLLIETNSDNLNKNVIIKDNDKCIVYINGVSNNNIITLEEAKQFIIDNSHKHIKFDEYINDSNILIANNMENVVEIKEVTNINELDTTSKYLLCYKDLNNNFFSLSTSTINDGYNYIKSIKLENDDSIVLLNNEVCTFTLNQNGPGWGFKAQNGMFLDSSEPTLEVLGNLYYFLRNEESCISNSYLWEITIGDLTEIKSFQETDFSLQYNVNAGYFGSYEGNNHNVKIYKLNYLE